MRCNVTKNRPESLLIRAGYQQIDFFYRKNLFLKRKIFGLNDVTCLDEFAGEKVRAEEQREGKNQKKHRGCTEEQGTGPGKKPVLFRDHHDN